MAKQAQIHTPTLSENKASRAQLRRVPDDALFTLEEARQLLALPRHTLAREARLGRLRTSRRAGRLWTVGSWLHEWIEGGEVRRQPRGEGAGEPDGAVA